MKKLDLLKTKFTVITKNFKLTESFNKIFAQTLRENCGVSC